MTLVTRLPDPPGIGFFNEFFLGRRGLDTKYFVYARVPVCCRVQMQARKNLIGLRTRILEELCSAQTGFRQTVFLSLSVFWTTLKVHFWLCLAVLLLFWIC